ADDRDAPRGPCDLAVEVRERGGHLTVTRVGDALAVVFDGADALIACGHQGVPPRSVLGEVGHRHVPAFMNQPRWSMKPAPKSRITRISTPSTSQPERLSTCGPSAPER